jgi:hypothetical protein
MCVLEETVEQENDRPGLAPLDQVVREAVRSDQTISRREHPRC